MNKRICDTLPSGFAFANRLQLDEYQRTGSIHGASKLCMVGTAIEEPRRLAVRLRPPRRWGDVISPIARSEAFRLRFRVTDPDNAELLEWYISEYNRGWAARKRAVADSSEAWEDGYLDAAAGRPKWHYTYCTDHDNCGEA